jgi:hypothetical protein
MDAMFGGAAGAGAGATPATAAFLSGFVHNWGKEAFVRGAYSTPTFGEDTSAAGILREAHAGGRVHFAGEATAGSVDGNLRHLPAHRANYASPIVLHGAMNSGALAATEIAAGLGVAVEAAPPSGRLFTPTYKFQDPVAGAAAAALAAHRDAAAPPPPPPALLVWKQAAPPSPLLTSAEPAEPAEPAQPAPASPPAAHHHQHSAFAKAAPAPAPAPAAAPGSQQHSPTLAPFVLAPSQRRRFKGLGLRSLPLLLLQAPHIVHISTWSARKAAPEGSASATTRATGGASGGGGFFHAKRVALLNQLTGGSPAMSWKFW